MKTVHNSPQLLSLLIKMKTVDYNSPQLLPVFIKMKTVHNNSL